MFHLGSHQLVTVFIIIGLYTITYFTLNNHSYFIPEDGDLESQPNVFLAPKPRQAGYPPSLGEIKNAFPLSGSYHFRFKSPLIPGTDREKGAMPVWMDCVDDRQPVPTWKNQVIAKVTRIAVDDEEDDDDDDFHRPAAANTAPPPQQQHQQHHAPPPAPVAAPTMDFFDAAPAAPQHHHHHSADLLGGMSHTPHQQHHHDDLLGMGSAPVHHTPPVSGNSYPQQHQQSGPFF